MAGALAPHALASAAAPGHLCPGQRCPAVRGAGGSHLLGRIRHPFQLHRRRLPDLHPGGDRQYSRVLPGGLAARRCRCAGAGHHLAAAPADPRRSAGAGFTPRSLAGGCCGGAAALAVVEAGRHRPDAVFTECLRQRIVRQRPGDAGGRPASQRSRLPAVLRHLAAGAGRPDPFRAGGGARAADGSAENRSGRGRELQSAARAVQAAAAEYRADHGGKPVGQIPGQLRQ